MFDEDVNFQQQQQETESGLWVPQAGLWVPQACPWAPAADQLPAEPVGPQRHGPPAGLQHAAPSQSTYPHA